MTMVSFFITYRFLTKPRGRPAPAKPLVLSPRAGTAGVVVTLLLVLAFSWLAVLTYLENLPNISMFNMGMSMIMLGLMLHIYRHTAFATART